MATRTIALTGRAKSVGIQATRVSPRDTLSMKRPTKRMSTKTTPLATRTMTRRGKALPTRDTSAELG